MASGTIMCPCLLYNVRHSTLFHPMASSSTSPSVAMHFNHKLHIEPLLQLLLFFKKNKTGSLVELMERGSILSFGYY